MDEPGVIEKSGGQRLLPSWLTGYKHEWLRLDFVAGLIAAAVVIPKAMAYATVAGLPIQAGLCTALIPMLIYAFFGASRPLSVSTTTTIAILVGTQLSLVVPDGESGRLMQALAMLTLLVGIFLGLACLLRMGFLANFISESILVGFKGGIALVIILDQIPKLLGVHFAKGSFVQNAFSVLQSIPETSLVTLGVGGLTIAVLLGLEHIFPRVPAPLVAVAGGILAMRLLGLERFGVESLGAIPQGLPEFIRPDFSLMGQLWPGALGIALMSFTETMAAGRAFADRDDPPLRPNRELMATGLANAGGALLGAMPAGGGTSQTAVNRLAGARTQLAGITTAGVTLLTMLVLAPVIGLMPQATLAAIVIVYSIGLFKPKEFRAILRVRRMEFFWALIALAGVVTLGTLKGIVVAIVVSLVSLAYQVADPPVRRLGRKPGTNIFRPLGKEHPEDEIFPGLLLIRLEGRVFFANAERIGEKIKQITAGASPKVLAVHLRSVPDLEYTALRMMIDAEKRLRERGIMLWLVGLNTEAFEMIQRSPLGEILGRERMHYNLETAVAKYLADNPEIQPCRGG